VELAKVAEVKGHRRGALDPRSDFVRSGGNEFMREPAIWPLPYKLYGDVRLCLNMENICLQSTVFPKVDRVYRLLSDHRVLYRGYKGVWQMANLYILLSSLQ
jgi:hypothetical protein